MRQTEAISRFLIASTHADLANLYNPSMEVQVNVARDNGERFEGEYNGKKWLGWTNSTGEIWKPFRIPYNANDVPTYDLDKEIKFKIEDHVEGIGMTGWDWQARVSKWVAFDFDAITGHSDKHAKKLSEAELNNIQEAVKDIPWVTLRLSTSGKGLHLYVFLNDVPTQNHTEHAALARSILGLLSAACSFDFQSKVDICGGNMWVWHRKMLGTNGLSLLKEGRPLDIIPSNWRDHLVVVKGQKKRNVPDFIAKSDVPEIERLFEELSGQRSTVTLDDQHKALINYLNENGASWWWDQDHNMLVCHTFDLKSAHESLNFKGIYRTISTGREHGIDHNCLSGNTEIITRDGVFKIKDLVGKFVELYVKTENGFKWIKSEIKSFGQQITVPIEFGDHSKVRSTLTHEWLIDGKTYRKQTQNLRLKNEYLPLAQFDLPIPDLEGYAHGFVYGDGWEKNTRGKLTTEVALFGTDVDLKPILKKFGKYGTQKYKGIYRDMFRQFPEHWKTLPKNISKEYALGFILGVISADGHISNQCINIFQSDFNALCSIRNLAIYAGLQCNPIRLFGHGSFVSTKDSWTFSINSYNLSKDHFYKRDQKESFQKSVKHKTTTVLDIAFDEPELEEVFCAVVPTYHNFTLANGVVTGNCFAYPLKNGGWVVRRFSQGAKEDDTWDQDGSGWTRCFLNVHPDLPMAARAFGGIEDPQNIGVFNFSEAEMAEKAVNMLGTSLELPIKMMNRPVRIKVTKDGRLGVDIDHNSNDSNQELQGKWLLKKGKWLRLFNVRVQTPLEQESGNYDDCVRHLVTESNENYGWVIKTEKVWYLEPMNHGQIYLTSLGLAPKDVIKILGSCIAKPWTVVNRPFQPEYIGDRQWNRKSAQLKFVPSTNLDNLSYPHWMGILNHIGKSLNTALLEDPWAKANAIQTGAEYLKCWIASLIQAPTEPLPYLFLYGNQNTGKSILHEGLSLLIDNGIERADTALINNSGFNAEIEHAVLCVVEEVDLGMNKQAYNRIKDWVTARQLPIHRKNQTPYTIINTTHWIQCANARSYCPLFPGDARITMMYVEELDPLEMIPKRQLLTLLEKEAPDFLAALLNLELPASNDRLNVPVIQTADKRQAEESNKTLLEEFLTEHCHYVSGKMTSVSEFYMKFREWCDPAYADKWTKIRVGKEMPTNKFPKGRNPKDGQFYWGNLSFTPYEPGDPVEPVLIKNEKDQLVPKC